jgi:isoquinoline 1-oxidoreductase alpha subunit
MATFNLNINNKKDHLLPDVPPGMPLLWALRDLAGLTGTKFGCGMAQCGACTIHLNDQNITH